MEILITFHKLHKEINMSVERSEEVMRRYIAEVIGEQKLEVINEIAAEDMFDRGQPKPGRDGLWKHVRDFLTIVPNPKVVLHEIVANEDTAIGIWHWRGTPVAEFFHIQPTGREVRCNVASHFKLRDGLLVEYRAFGDGLDGHRSADYSGAFSGWTYRSQGN
jgi:predicted ester cyclase